MDIGPTWKPRSETNLDINTQKNYTKVGPSKWLSRLRLAEAELGNAMVDTYSRNMFYIKSIY